MKFLSFGSLNLNYTYRVPHIVRPGETLSSTRLEVYPGGKGLNQSVALARAGAQVFHAGVVLFDDETKELAKEIVRCGGLDGKVDIALDFFDASINRVAAWVTGYRNLQKALLFALLQPNENLKAMQDKQDFTRLMMVQEELKTFPFGEVWAEYCKQCNVPADESWYDEVMAYEANVQSKRG